MAWCWSEVEGDVTVDGEMETPANVLLTKLKTDHSPAAARHPQPRHTQPLCGDRAHNREQCEGEIEARSQQRP